MMYVSKYFSADLEMKLPDWKQVGFIGHREARCMSDVLKELGINRSPATLYRMYQNRNPVDYVMYEVDPKYMNAFKKYRYDLITEAQLKSALSLRIILKFT